MRRNVWDELRELDRPFLDLFRTYTGPVGLRPWLPLTSARPFLPTVDMYARDGDMVVCADLPGIDPAKDISVIFEEGQLTIKGERRQEQEIDEAGYYRREIVHGAFERNVPLPEGVKEAEVTARYEAGVLEVVIPGGARPPAKPEAKAIPVTTTS